MFEHRRTNVFVEDYSRTRIERKKGRKKRKNLLFHEISDPRVKPWYNCVANFNSSRFLLRPTWRSFIRNIIRQKPEGISPKISPSLDNFSFDHQRGIPSEKWDFASMKIRPARIKKDSFALVMEKQCIHACHVHSTNNWFEGREGGGQRDYLFFFLPFARDMIWPTLVIFAPRCSICQSVAPIRPFFFSFFLFPSFHPSIESIHRCYVQKLRD